MGFWPWLAGSRLGGLAATTTAAARVAPDGVPTAGLTPGVVMIDGRACSLGRADRDESVRSCDDGGRQVHRVRGAQPVGGRRGGRDLGGHRLEYPQLESADQAGEGGEFLSASVPHRLHEDLRQQQS
jgi:hypothetical protein